MALRSNLSLKLGALVVGLVLWLHVKTDQTYESVISVPFQVAEASGRFIVANDVPSTVEIRIAGSGKNLLFRRHHARVLVRPYLTQREAITVDLSSDQIEGIEPNSGFEVIGVESPRSVLLDFDYFDTREVPVIPRVGITTRPGYSVVGRPHTEPKTVRLGGPRRYVRELESVDTDSITLVDVASDVNQSVAVAAPEGKHLEPSPDHVAVRAEVQVLLERRFSDVPVTISHVPRGVRAEVIPNTVAVDVTGGDQLVSSLSAKDFAVEVDYRQRFEKGLDDLPLAARLPKYVTLVRISPPTASLVVRQTTRPRR
jgi:hypothetical protein